MNASGNSLPPEINAIAHEFLAQCAFADDIEAAFVTGSHVSDNADVFSDIDIYIVIKDADWRERGNARMRGKLVEYFANPMRQIKKYIDQAFVTGNMSIFGIIQMGIPLVDNNECLAELKAYAAAKLVQEATPPSTGETALAKYHLWDTMDELERCRNYSSPDFLLQCQHLFSMIFTTYCRHIQYYPPPLPKLYRVLTDMKYRAGYGLSEIPDECFRDLSISFLETKDEDEMYRLIKEIYRHVISIMGGFAVDSFVYRSKCDE